MGHSKPGQGLGVILCPSAELKVWLTGGIETNPSRAIDCRRKGNYWSVIGRQRTSEESAEGDVDPTFLLGMIDASNQSSPSSQKWNIEEPIGMLEQKTYQYTNLCSYVSTVSTQISAAPKWAPHPNMRRSKAVAEEMSAAPKRAPRRSLEFRNDNPECELYVTVPRNETYPVVYFLFLVFFVKNHRWGQF